MRRPATTDTPLQTFLQKKSPHAPPCYSRHPITDITQKQARCAALLRPRPSADKPSRHGPRDDAWSAANTETPCGAHRDRCLQAARVRKLAAQLFVDHQALRGGKQSRGGGRGQIPPQRCQHGVQKALLCQRPAILEGPAAQPPVPIRACPHWLLFTWSIPTMPFTSLHTGNAVHFTPYPQCRSLYSIPAMPLGAATFKTCHIHFLPVRSPPLQIAQDLCCDQKSAVKIFIHSGIRVSLPPSSNFRFMLHLTPFGYSTLP